LRKGENMPLYDITSFGAQIHAMGIEAGDAKEALQTWLTMMADWCDPEPDGSVRMVDGITVAPNLPGREYSTAHIEVHNRETRECELDLRPEDEPALDLLAALKRYLEARDQLRGAPEENEARIGTARTLLAMLREDFAQERRKKAGEDD
jgi:hypothetical protein